MHTGTISKIDEEIDAVMGAAMIVINDVVELPSRVTHSAKVAGSITKTDFIAPWGIRPGLRSAACIYEEDRPVTWLPMGAAKDRLHHLLMVTVTKGGLLLLTTTDADHRAALLQHLQFDYFANWKPVSQAVLVKALVEGEKLKTLWLTGVHRDTGIKPTSKIISGSDLVDAIDPMNDASFLAGAVRSTKGGVSLRNSSVWTGPNSNLQTFEARTVNLLTLVDLAIQAKPGSELQVHGALASWVDDLANVNGCYAVSQADHETLDGASGRAKAKALADQFRVELNALGASAGQPACAFAVLVTEIKSSKTAVVEVEPYLVDGRIQYLVATMPAAPFNEWASAISESSALLRAYYDSGHTITGGTLALVRRQESPFKGFVYGNFNKYNVTQEKPPAPVTLKNGKKVSGAVPLLDMMTDTDESLFKWIFKEGLTLLGLKKPSPKGVWLYCDDGASEVADFVHLDVESKPKRLTLVHAKGADSDSGARQAAPGPYELVAAQAIKNLRALDAQLLLDRIRERLKKNGSKRIWDQPWAVNLAPLPDAKAFEAALGKLGTNYDCEVIIVQPHVRKSDFVKRVGSADTVGASQLRTLLFGVESLARAVNAEFRVVADRI
ncbi:hypothetical protein [Inhella crocodyli]|uniref:Uncharacterized protein n=1 Tax=Inhella crocodyli TaxID=2499851 RepID=A0A437LSG9_9BURK|nr:hypothetical protein [Inhella crocodyli]RVT88350.1 hypothetical protein EOD73_05025 [Inhella crocodyli]